MAPKKELVTESDVRRMGPGVTQLVLGPARMATPAALDLAFARGLRVVYGGGEPASDPSSPAGALWERMKAVDGTFVVQVQDGRAVVTRIGDGAPEPFGSEG